ncbi:hypothetical protein MSG28_000957 [Choristoneura fumiferana]|uniref:Uncharacterized protein n=1 Tax=Choristoneura fumiferana TaxID=7141 RepID=A0ACC0K3G1_CHOFU|nr:hypothetical protein MSG28_000957 [Choristoneura fumiferana]
MHEDAPKMSVTQSLAASTSQPKSEFGTEVAVDYDIMSSTDAKPPEHLDIDIQVAYVDPSTANHNK